MSSFMAQVSITDGCWFWTGDPNSAGYGSFQSGLFRANAHRFMYCIMNDDEPEVVRHTCGNRMCVKPTHLIAGSQVQNMQDKFFDGTQNTQKLTVDDVRSIRARFTRTSPRKSNAKELAAKYGVTVQYICRIADGRSLNYV